MNTKKTKETPHLAASLEVDSLRSMLDETPAPVAPVVPGVPVVPVAPGVPGPPVPTPPAATPPETSAKQPKVQTEGKPAGSAAASASSISTAIAALLLLFSAPVANAQLAFEQLGPAGGAVTRLIQFSDGRLVAYQVSDDIVFESLDDGQTWSRSTYSIPSPLGINPVVTTSGGNTFTGGRGEAVFVSSDGGRNWADYVAHIGSADTMVPSSLAIGPADRIYMGGGAPAQLFASDNDGSSWTLVSAIDGMESPTVTGTDASGNVAVFGSRPQNPTPRYVTAHSPDDGLTWTTRLTEANMDVLVISSDGGTVGKSIRQVLRLDDTTSEWREVFASDNFISDLVQLDDGTMLVSGFVGVMRSTDAGRTWTPTDQTDPVHDLTALQSGDVLAGTSNATVRSSDGGATWTPSAEGIRLAPAFSVLRDAAGELLVGVFGGLLSTSDDDLGSATSVLEYQDARSPKEMVELKNNDLYVFSSFGDVDLRSAGIWTHIRVSTDAPAGFGGGAVGQQGTVAIAANQALHVTTDGGVTWTNQYQNIPTTDGSIRAVTIGDDGTILAGAADGLFRSNDDGITWTVVSSMAAYAVYIISDGSILVSSDDHVFRSSDEGASWTQVDYEFDNRTGLDRLIEQNDGSLIASECSSLRRSNDSGQTWEVVAIWTERCHRGFQIDSDGQLYLASFDEGLLKSVGTAIVGVGVETELPAEAILLGVYPNPILDSARFAFSLTASAAARIEVYNLMGQRVLVAFDQVLSSGAHDVAANFGTLAAGTYVTRLVVDGQQWATRTVARIR
jgi:photosystem II stability/assembly factor-like uncharacterized protein